MNIDEFHQKHIEIVRMNYADKEDQDYDAAPVLLMWEPSGVCGIAPILDASDPPTAAAMALEQIMGSGTEIEMVSFASPAWTKNTDGERIGECIIIQTENTERRLLTMIDVKRNPLRLGESATTEPGLHVRTSFLYHEKKVLQ